MAMMLSADCIPFPHLFQPNSSHHQYFNSNFSPAAFFLIPFLILLSSGTNMLLFVRDSSFYVVQLLCLGVLGRIVKEYVRNDIVKLEIYRLDHLHFPRGSVLSLTFAFFLEPSRAGVWGFLREFNEDKLLLLGPYFDMATQSWNALFLFSLQSNGEFVLREF